jgi:Ni/Co efflux regulator RcnB
MVFDPCFHDDTRTSREIGMTMRQYARVIAAVAALGLANGAVMAQGLLNPPGGRNEGPRPEQGQQEQRPDQRNQAPRPEQRPQPPRQEQRAQPQRGDNRNQSYDQRGQGNERRGDPHDWQRGQRIERNEWARGGRFDYRERHLRQPPRGYEWREFNGTYILGAIATGVIADIIFNSQR